jgi:hypothetical protein
LEKVIIEYFKKIIKNQSASDRKKQLQLFRNELVELLKEPENEVVNKYFDFVKWIDSKLI